jgi:urease accessory protein
VAWQGRLELHYTRDGERIVAHDTHSGPLRVLKRLYPEGPGICHHVIVHPPGGIVGGDVLAIEATLERGTHALVTTPGATRFYRSAGEQAIQSATLRVADGARLEWLPLETIAQRGCIAQNRVTVQLDESGEAMGWDVLALGLPAADEHFDDGSFVQHLELPGAWLERGRISAADNALLDSPLGWAGQRVLATLWFVVGHELAPARRDALLDAARQCISASPLAARAGATSPHARVVVLRALAARVEPAMALLVAARAAWREAAWHLAGETPRIWRT